MNKVINTMTIFLVSLISIILVQNAFSQSPQTIFRFSSGPDWHLNETQLYQGTSSYAFPGEKTFMLTRMESWGSQLQLLAGDLIGGFWYQDTWLPLVPANMRTADIYTRMEHIGNTIYRRFIAEMNEQGYKIAGAPGTGKEFLICPGDHEYGDNGWQKGRSDNKDEYVTMFRKVFANNFNRNADSTSLYNGTFNGVTLRPVGTQFEHTTCAVKRGNVLFVSLDLHAYEPNVAAGQETVINDLRYNLRPWLENLLTAAKNDTAIDFTVVQSHYPCIPVTNLRSSSGVLVPNGAASELWSLFRKYDVDVYVGGEVHTLSINLDKSAPGAAQEYAITQLVHGNDQLCLWETAKDGAKDLLSINLYEKALGTNDNYSVNPTGVLTITRQGGKKTVAGEGHLAPLDQKGLLVQWDFDKESPFINNGQSSDYMFIGYGYNVTYQPGVLGNAVSFTGAVNSLVRVDNVYSAVFDMSHSLTAWVKTTMTGEGTILMAGSSGWAGLILKVVDGKVAIKGSNKIIKTTGPVVNDGQWHHVAVSHFTEGPLEEASVYVDGNLVQKENTGSTTKVNYTRCAVVAGAEWIWYNGEVTAPYKGLIDDPGHWAGALSLVEVKAIVNSAVNSDLKYNSSQMDHLFRIYRNKSQGSVAGKNWSFTAGLTGGAGTITKNGTSNYSIVLNSSGEGVTTGPVSIRQNGIPTNKAKSTFNVQRLTDGYHINCTNLTPGNYTIRLFGANGQWLRTYAAKSSGQVVSIALERDQRLLPGTYVVSIDTERGTSLVRFVKM